MELSGESFEVRETRSVIHLYGNDTGSGNNYWRRCTGVENLPSTYYTNVAGELTVDRMSEYSRLPGGDYSKTDIIGVVRHGLR